MPDIRPDEISIATCDAARWQVALSCGPCRNLKPLQLEKLRNHKVYRRPFVWLARDAVVFRCSVCKSPSTGVFVSRPGDGPVFSLDLLKG